MKVGIIGSRKRKDRKSVYAYVDTLPKNTIVVSGGCYGPDRWAEERAKQRGLKTIIHRPQIEKAANYIQMVNTYYNRNQKIVNDSDKIVAFPAKDGIERGGTWYTINYAKKKGVPVELL